jgi:pimeloyl-ACP methyl ester carboxylesterase
LLYLPDNVALGSFDFMGCGKNLEADNISLGYREAQQVKTVTEHLRLTYDKVILWGRSMGAAAALLYG